MRRASCPSCRRPSLYYSRCDTFGCAHCDIWTEKPHSCDPCDAGFEPTPERPSMYQGVPEDFVREEKDEIGDMVQADLEKRQG